MHNPHIWRKRRKKKEKEEEKAEGEEGKEGEGEKSGQEGEAEEEEEEEEEFMTDEEVNKLLKLDLGREPLPHELALDDEVMHAGVLFYRA